MNGVEGKEREECCYVQVLLLCTSTVTMNM